MKGFKFQHQYHGIPHVNVLFISQTQLQLCTWFLKFPFVNNIIFCYQLVSNSSHLKDQKFIILWLHSKFCVFHSISLMHLNQLSLWSMWVDCEWNPLLVTNNKPASKLIGLCSLLNWKLYVVPSHQFSDVMKVFSKVLCSVIKTWYFLVVLYKHRFISNTVFAKFNSEDVISVQVFFFKMYF